MSEKRKPISKFIKQAWTNMNIRAGKYKHLQSKKQEHSNKCYENIKIEFTRDEFKQWCLLQENFILSLKKPSVDRKDSTKNYSLDNIQIIELTENLKRKAVGNSYIKGPKSKTERGVTKRRNKWIARITYNYSEHHIGSYDNKEEALNAFIKEYTKIHGKKPF